MTTNTGDVAIVGAGMAGLSCARRLREAGLTVQLFDKGRGVGGRVATRRVADGGAEFDHGAQYFTARSPAFVKVVADCVERNVVAEWEGRLVSLHAGVISPEPSPTTRYVGVPRMSALPRWLAEGLPVRLDTRVTALRREESGWGLELAGGEQVGPFRALVLTAPPTQSAELLGGPGVVAAGGALDSLREQVARVEVAPCWAVLARFPWRLGMPFDGAFVEGSPLRWIARNGSKPGRPAGECWVLHAGPEWSREHLELEPAEAGERLLEAFWKATGRGHSTPAEVIVHRWRYALPEDPLADRCLLDESGRLGLCGDWCGGPRVEGAFLSGRTLGERLAGILGGPKE